MKALPTLLLMTATFVAGGYAGSLYTLQKANQQIDNLALFSFATDLRHNVDVAEALQQGRTDDAMETVEYMASTTYAVLCAKAQQPDAGVDLYVSDAISDAAGQLQRKDCLGGRQL